MFKILVVEDDKDLSRAVCSFLNQSGYETVGCRIGIDDYMVKPIDLDELFLRIGALLRRAKIASSHRLEIGKLILDADERTAIRGSGTARYGLSRLPFITRF